MYLVPAGNDFISLVAMLFVFWRKNRLQHFNGQRGGLSFSPAAQKKRHLTSENNASEEKPKHCIDTGIPVPAPGIHSSNKNTGVLAVSHAKHIRYDISKVRCFDISIFRYREVSI